MPITPVQEFFNKGLVNVRDGSLLAPGELQQCDNCVYRPFDPAIQAAPGRQAIHASGFTGAVKGLAWLSADNTTDQLLAYNGTNLYLTAFTAITGLTWTALQGIGTLSDVGSEQMNVVKYDVAYHVLNGVNQPRRVQFVTPTAKVVTTCTIASTVTVTSSEVEIFTDLVVGQGVSGTGVPAGTVISAKNYTITSGVYKVTSLTLSQACTNGAVTLTFSSTTFVNGRVFGMFPTGQMLNAPTIISGTWPNSGDYGGVGSYWFFYTEAVIPGEIDNYTNGFAESACTIKDSDLRRVDITSVSTQAVRIQRNDNLVNDGGTDRVQATHWFVYMSPKSSDPLTVPARNRFVRIGGPIPINVTTRDLTTTAQDTGWKLPTAGSIPAGYTSPTNPSAAFTPGGARATYVAGNGAYYTTFGISTSALAVVGIKVEVGAYGLGVIGIQLQRADGAGTTTKSSRTVVVHGSGIVEFGGALDTLSPSPSAWLGTDFFDDGSGSFRVLITGVIPSIDLDYIRVAIYYTGFSPGTIGANYRTVTYRSQVGTTIIDSAALPPPVSSTGAVYRSQFVTNSILNRNGIFFSSPGFPEYFPKPYFMTFDSPKKDVVTNIKRVGGLLIVGLQDNIQRVNFLPTELDTDGRGGLVYEPIATDHGVVGPRAAAVADIPGLGTVLVYASFKGIHYTEGIRPYFLNTDLNWLRTVKASALSTSEIVVYPSMNWIVFFYCPYGATHSRNTRALVFDYSPDKLKGSTLPAIGPITVSGRCAASATLSGVDYYLTGHEADGFVYAEDQGNAMPSGYYTQEAADGSVHTVVKNVPVIETRVFYAAGVERDSRSERTYFRYDTNGTTVAVAACAVSGTTVTKTSALGSVLAGMTVSGDGIRPGTIVTVAGASTLTLSHSVDTAGTVDLTFDTGTLEITVRGQGMREAMGDIESGYISTYEGNLNDIHLDNTRQALSIRIRKAALPSGTLVDLSTAMRLHYFSSLLSEEGLEQGRPA